MPAGTRAADMKVTKSRSTGILSVTGEHLAAAYSNNTRQNLPFPFCVMSYCSLCDAKIAGRQSGIVASELQSESLHVGFT